MNEEDEAEKKRYLNNNLNPLRNSMQLYYLLATIGDSNPRKAEKVENISEGLKEYMSEYLKDPRLIPKILRTQAT